MATQTKPASINFEIEFSIRQTQALDYLFDDFVSEILYGGAKGGGKSVFLCYAACLYAEHVIKLCKITSKKYVPVIGFLGRLQAVDFNDTTLETFKQYINPDIYEIRAQDKEIIFFDLVKYHYGGLDTQEAINKFNSAEYGFIAIDQAEELIRDHAAKLRGTQGRTKINGIEIPSKILWTANPGDCFLKQDFGLDGVSICPPDRKFVQALPSDNTFIDNKKYVQKLTEAWKHHPDILRAYVYGDWSATSGGGFLIDNDTCQRLTTLQLSSVESPRTWVSNDPAWLGDKTDEIVDYVFRGNRVIDSRFAYNQETTTTAANSVKLARQYGALAIGVDCIGVGAGVVSDCRALIPSGSDKSIKIIPINSASKPDEDTKKLSEKDNQQPKILYGNVRAEMYWTATEELKENKWILPNDTELIRQLCAVKYEIRNGKIYIEEKKDIKERLGRSPDRADAFVQGIWMKKYVPSKVFNSGDNKQFPSQQARLQRQRERSYNQWVSR